MKKTVLIMALAVIAILMIDSISEACGIIDIDRRILPPDVRVVNISVKNTTLDIRIEEQVAIVVVDEIFHNSNNRQLEGNFILPILPETAVQNLSLWINGKENKGELLDKDKALQYYQDVVRRMIDPALLEYAGYGLLRMRVFPIPAASQDMGQGPGNVRIKYTYTYRLPNDNGACEFRHPWGTNKFSAEPIDSALIKATIKSVIPIKNVYSPTYPNIDVSRKDDNNITFSFEQNKMKPDKDFILYYTLSDKQFGINLVNYRRPDTDGFFMLLASPKYDVRDNEVIKKDVVFVLDTSGSMLDNGKIDQAKNALAFCINSLKESDRFNLITFSSNIRPFKPGLQEVTVGIKAEALKWVNEIDARGGTNIDEALQSALAMADVAGKRPFIIVFLTDGMPTVGEQNTENILKNVASKNKTNSRIFTFGVGYDVNVHLLDKIGEANHGISDYIVPGENIEVKVSNFYEKTAFPVLSDVKLEVSGIEIYDRYPKNLPDIFRGTQLVIFGRYKGQGNKLITLSGTVNGEPRRFEYEATFTANNESTDFIPRLWAASKVGYLLEEIRLHGENKEVKEEVVKVAMEYGILTPYTSYLVMEDKKLVASAPAVRDWVNSEPAAKAAEENHRAKSDMREVSGRTAVTVNQTARRLQQGQMVNDELEGGLKDAVNNNVRQVADKTFYQNNSIWYDNEYQDSDKDKIQQVKYLSDEYFALIAKHPRLARYFSQGEQVVVRYNNQVYQVMR